MGALLDYTPMTNQEEVYALECITFEVGTQRTFHYCVLIPTTYPWQTLMPTPHCPLLSRVWLLESGNPEALVSI